MDQELERHQIKDSVKREKRLSKPRIPPFEGEWHKLISQEYISFKKVYDDNIINIFKTIARYPKLMKNWYPFFVHIVRSSRLPKRDSELIILRIGWLCQSEYEWSRHVTSAKEIGFSDEEIIRITKGPKAEGWNEFERTLLHAVDELYFDAFISDETWKILSEKYNEQKLMDLIFTVGEYNLVSMFLNTIGVQLEEGDKGFPE